MATQCGIPKGQPGYVDPRRGRHKKSDSEYKGAYRRQDQRPVHRTLVEKRTGITLPATAVIHHFDPTDKLTNKGTLVVCQDATYHALIEQRTRAYNACGHASWRKCRECKQYDDPANLRIWQEPGRPGSFKVSHYRWHGRCVNKGERADIRPPHQKPALQRGTSRRARLRQANLAAMRQAPGDSR